MSNTKDNISQQELYEKFCKDERLIVIRKKINTIISISIPIYIIHNDNIQIKYDEKTTKVLNELHRLYAEILTNDYNVITQN